MSEVLSTVTVPLPPVEVSFDVTPKSTAYNVSGWTWPAVGSVPAVYTYLVNTSLTFTATTVEPIDDVTVEEVRWRFGDGTEATGTTVTHTYTMVREMIVHCSVRDNLGRWTHTTKVLYLKP